MKNLNDCKEDYSMSLAVAILGASTAVSVGVNIYQGVQNRKLRRQIEMLEATIRNLKSDIEELKKEVEAVKFWAFTEKFKLKKEMKQLKFELKQNKRRLEVLNAQAA